jgi:outer membrane protein assembly factor BamB
VITVIDSSGLTGSNPFLIVTNWPQQRFDPGNTANNPFEWKLDTTTVQTLTPAWNTVGRPGPCPSTTAIVMGFVVYFNNETTGLQALDPATGNLLWGFDTSGQNNCNCGTSPTGANVAGKQLVFLGNGLSKMAAVNTSTHAEAWSQGGFSPSGFEGWPVAVGSALFISDFDGNLASLKQTNGIANWKQPQYSNDPIAWNKGVLFTGYVANDGFDYMRAYNANSGAFVWGNVNQGCAFGPTAPVAAYTLCVQDLRQ